MSGAIDAAMSAGEQARERAAERGGSTTLGVHAFPVTIENDTATGAKSRAAEPLEDWASLWVEHRLLAVTREARLAAHTTRRSL